MKQLLSLGLVWVAAGLYGHAAESRPEVAAYYFPNYHPNSQNSARYGTNWTEWEFGRTSGATCRSRISRM